MSHFIDGWIVGALLLCLLAAIPMALVSVIYSIMLLGMFSVLLIPLGIMYTIQWVGERCRRWYGR